MESPGVARQEDWYGCSIISPATQAPLWIFVPPSLRCGPHLHVHNKAGISASTFSFQAQRKGKEIDINIRAFSDIPSSDSLIFHWPGPYHVPPPLAERGGEIPFFFFFGTEHCHSQHNHTIRFSKKEKKIDSKWAISSIRHIQEIFVPGFACSSKIILNMMTLLLAS